MTTLLIATTADWFACVFFGVAPFIFLFVVTPLYAWWDDRHPENQDRYPAPEFTLNGEELRALKQLEAEIPPIEP